MVRRYAANYVITNTGEPIRNGIVSIDETGKVVEIAQLGDSGVSNAEVHFFNGYLTPGFVNTHTHLELSFFDGVFLPGGSMVAFLRQIDSLRMDINQEIIDSALVKAYEALRRDGQVAYGDISNAADTVPFKANEEFESVTFVEMFGANVELANKAFAEGQRVLGLFREAGVKHAYLTPHAPYTVSYRLLDLLETPVQDAPIYSLHFAETGQEWEFMRTGGGAIDNLYKNIWHREVQIPTQEEYLRWIERMGRDGKRTLLVHCVRLEREEMARLKAACPELSIALCPQSNLFMEGRLADIEGMREAGLRITVGTDSLSSSPTLSVLEQLKVINRYYPSIPVPELLLWATRNGAEALGFTQLGKLAVGTTPGLNAVVGDGVLQGDMSKAEVKPLAGLHGLREA